MDLRTGKREWEVKGGPFFFLYLLGREEKRHVLMLPCNRTVLQNSEYLATQILLLSFYIVRCTSTCFCSPTCLSLFVVYVIINEINTYG